MGAVALASSLKQIKAIGMEAIEAYENALMKHLIDGLKAIDGIRIYGCQDGDVCTRLGVVSFNIEGVNHALAAAILAYEYGIGVRSGCFCAHPYVMRLLEINEAAADRFRKRILTGDKTEMPGMIRASIGLYNTFDDIERLLHALKNIAKGNFIRNYRVETKTGTYVPDNWEYDFRDFYNMS